MLRSVFCLQMHIFLISIAESPFISCNSLFYENNPGRILCPVVDGIICGSGHGTVVSVFCVAVRKSKVYRAGGNGQAQTLTRCKTGRDFCGADEDFY